MANAHSSLFEGWEIAVAKQTVRQFLERAPGLRGWEFDDLLQECLLHWIRNRRSYRAGGKASRKTYMGKVLRNRLADIVRHEFAEKRMGYQRAESLDNPQASDAEGKADSAGPSDGPSTGPSFSARRVELKIDLDGAIGLLTPRQQKLCRLLQKGASVKEAARELGVPRSTLHDEKERIRQVFKNRGLKDYQT